MKNVFKAKSNKLVNNGTAKVISLVLMQYLGRYTPEQARRHEVRPGVTGWAQINGRNAISWEEKFKLDVWYVDHHTLWLDIKILLMTLVKVFNREGISAAGEATMNEFKGSENG